jgi:hypothetical protein
MLLERKKANPKVMEKEDWFFLNGNSYVGLQRIAC